LSSFSSLIAVVGVSGGRTQIASRVKFQLNFKLQLLSDMQLGDAVG